MRRFFLPGFSRHLSLAVLATMVLPVVAQPSLAREISTAPAEVSKNPLGGKTGVFAAELTPGDDKDHSQERKEIEALLSSIEREWNAHNLDGVLSYYADDYINNDGLDKKAVGALTQDFWKTYPDAKSNSTIKSIRVEGPFVTVESQDVADGSTAKEMPGIGGKGELSSISEGQLYVKKVGPNWKIIGDRIDYERVRVAFGIAKQIPASFAAPDQVRFGNQYSARLELNLPAGLAAVGSITAQPLQYPQPQPTDAWRPMENPILERVMNANTKNRNELLMATVGITNAARNSLMGIAFYTRRLNVVPKMEVESDATKVTANAPISVPTTGVRDESK